MCDNAASVTSALRKHTGVETLKDYRRMIDGAGTPPRLLPSWNETDRIIELVLVMKTGRGGIDDGAHHLRRQAVLSASRDHLALCTPGGVAGTPFESAVSAVTQDM